MQWGASATRRVSADVEVAGTAGRVVMAARLPLWGAGSRDGISHAGTLDQHPQPSSYRQLTVPGNTIRLEYAFTHPLDGRRASLSKPIMSGRPLRPPLTRGSSSLVVPRLL